MIERQLRAQAKIDTAALNRLKAELRDERALADDLYLALSQLLASPIWANQQYADEALARYREARK